MIILCMALFVGPTDVVDVVSHEALHSASPELHLTLYEFESASDVIPAMLNVVPHVSHCFYKLHVLRMYRSTSAGEVGCQL